jgi:hypothetical protein
MAIASATSGRYQHLERFLGMKMILSISALSLALGTLTNAAPQFAPKGSGGFGSLMSGINMTSTIDPNDDMITTMCKTHDGKNPLGLMVEAIFGMGPNGKGPDEKCMKDDSGGTGPFTANYTTDSTLPEHTIYTPKTPPPASEKMPVIVWGNGACAPVGTMFYNFLNEIASYGIFIIANGAPKGSTMGGMGSKALIESIDWVKSNPAVKKYGNVDINMIVAAGQSCGGLEAVKLTSSISIGTDTNYLKYEASLNDRRINMTVLFNSGYLMGSNAQMMSKFKGPVAYFLGGRGDMAQANVKTYHSLRKNTL